jgi:peroxiredoxin Q/BCP
MSTPAAGDRAPEVALPDEHGTIHRLSEQSGRWTILYFYPADDTPGCTIEASDFRDRHASITDMSADVWGVSPDGATSHEKFKSKCGLPFTLLSDPDHAVIEAYGAWVEKTNYGRTSMGVQRSSYLIDPTGRVAVAWPKVKAAGHAEDVVAALQAVQGKAG